MRLSSSPRCRAMVEELGQRDAVRFPIRRQPLAVLRRALARGVEQVVANEDAGQVHVGSQRTELGFDLVMMGIEMVELRVDLLRAPRGGRQGKDDEQQQAGQPDGGHRPRPKPHRVQPAQLHRIQPTGLTRQGPSGRRGASGREPAGARASWCVLQCICLRLPVFTGFHRCAVNRCTDEHVPAAQRSHCIWPIVNRTATSGISGAASRRRGVRPGVVNAVEPLLLAQFRRVGGRGHRRRGSPRRQRPGRRRTYRWTRRAIGFAASG